MWKGMPKYVFYRLLILERFVGSISYSGSDIFYSTVPWTVLCGWPDIAMAGGKTFTDLTLHLYPISTANETKIESESATGDGGPHAHRLPFARHSPIRGRKPTM